MPLGMEVGVGPGDFVFDGNPAAPRKKGLLYFLFSLPHNAMLARVMLSVVSLSVCLSVCPSVCLACSTLLKIRVEVG